MAGTIKIPGVNFEADLSQIEQSFEKGFQGFVDESSLLTAVNGAPSVGQFRTYGIVGRASIPDLANDLRARMGIDRVYTQDLVELQNEFGPNGERVFSALNDDRNLIRYVGDWRSYNNVTGQFLNGDSGFVEITFYGTGLNQLDLSDGGARDFRATVDGGAEGANFRSTISNVLVDRKYNQNLVVPVVSGLALGLHTVKIRFVSSGPLQITGFEILNESANINVRPGTAFVNGRKLTLVAASSVAYNSGFETVTREGSAVAFSSVRGARVLEYLKSDGTKGKAAYLTNSAQANLGSASHDYEEVIRRYDFREFGAGRSDDFSLFVANGTTAAFTLDDGTTTLAGSPMGVNASPYGLFNNNVGFITFTFVGTGVDVFYNNAAPATAIDSHSFIVDGTVIGSITTSSTGTLKVVSGLPYGTHTLKISRTVAAVNQPFLTHFLVYGPKKPTLPAGAVELADYNVMADFVANAVAGLETIATGVLRKQNIRESIYVGSWSIGSVSPTQYTSGFFTQSNTSGNYVEYTFYGTGFELRGWALTTASTNITATLNGLAATTANFASLTSSAYGGWAFASGVLNQNNTNTTGAGLRVSGLPLAKYTVRFTVNTAAFIDIQAFDIITPIHSPKSNFQADLQNTLPVGSCGISDSRRLSPVKSESPGKAWAQAVGVTSGPTTTVTSPVPMPDMSCTVKTRNSVLYLSMFAEWLNSVAGNFGRFQFYVNGAPVGVDILINQAVAGYASIVSMQMSVPVSAGTHKVDVYWYPNAGTMTANGTRRMMTVQEL